MTVSHPLCITNTTFTYVIQLSQEIRMEQGSNDFETALFLSMAGYLVHFETYKIPQDIRIQLSLTFQQMRNIKTLENNHSRFCSVK